MSDVACGVHALDKLIHDECIYCLRARIAARDKQIEHHRTMSLARQDEIGLLRDRIRGNEITISELQIDLGECRRLLREACEIWVLADVAYPNGACSQHRYAMLSASWADGAANAAGGGDE